MIVLFFPYYPSPIVRAQLSILFRSSRLTLSITFRSVFSSSLSPSSSQFSFFLSIFLLSHSSFLSLVCSLLVPLPLATYLPADYLVLGTRYPVYSPTTTIGQHTPQQSDATLRPPRSFPSFLFAFSFSCRPAGGSFVFSSRFLEEEMHGAKTLRAHALYLLPFFFLLFLFPLLFLTSSASSSSSPSCYRLFVASLRESSSSHLSAFSSKSRSVNGRASLSE